MKVGIAITSYNRWNLLEPCLDSLFNLIGNKYPIVLVEDSCNLQMKENILNKYGDKLHLIFNETNQGQAKSIDIAYNYLNDNYDIEYIAKTECDYRFDANPNFIEEAIDILESRPDVHHIWLRHLENYKVSHGHDAFQNLFEPTVLTTYKGTPYYLLTNGHYPPGSSWKGFTFMANVHRMSDYLNFFPNGYDGIAKATNSRGVVAEYHCSAHTNQFNVRAAQLVNTCCYTIHNQSTY